MYYANPQQNGLLSIGQIFVTIIPGGDGDEDDLNDPNAGHWSRACLYKMLQPVVCNGHTFPLTAEAKRNLVEMAWYYDPDKADGQGLWDEAAISKMREPTTHSFQIFIDPDRLRRLAEMV